MPPTTGSKEPALPWREGTGLAYGGNQWGAAVDGGMLSLSDPQLADGSELEPVVHVSACVGMRGAVRLLHLATFGLQRAAS